MSLAQNCYHSIGGGKLCLNNNNIVLLSIGSPPESTNHLSLALEAVKDSDIHCSTTSAAAEIQ